jgi:hypothetical protein
VHRSKTASLFDYFVGATEQSKVSGNLKPGVFAVLKIENQLDCYRLHHRQLGWASLPASYEPA